MRPENDKVRVLSVRRGKDRLGRFAFPNEERRVNARSSGSSNDFLDPGLDPCPLLVDAAEKPAPGETKPPGIDHAEHEELRTGVCGQSDRLNGGPRGRRREVRGQQQATNCGGRTLGPVPIG